MTRASKMLNKSLILSACFSFAALYAPQVAAAETPESGAARLSAMFAESLDFTLNQGPYSDPGLAKWKIEQVFSDLTRPYCPHCPPRRTLTEEEEAGVSQKIRTKAEHDARAQYMLGARYLMGQGLPQNIAEGLYWLQKAVDSGSREAPYALARLYDDGLYVPVDKKKAAQFYRVSVPSHKAVASERLGEMYEFGIGVPIDYARAMELYKVAAEPMPGSNFRSQSAEFKIGRLYAEGKGVPRDYGKAAEWFLKSTDHGEGYGGADFEGQCALAILYSSGLGVGRDEAQAEFWLKRPNTLSRKACQTLRDGSQK